MAGVGLVVLLPTVFLTDLTGAATVSLGIGLLYLLLGVVSIANSIYGEREVYWTCALASLAFLGIGLSISLSVFSTEPSPPAFDEVVRISVFYLFPFFVLLSPIPVAYLFGVTPKTGGSRRVVAVSIAVLFVPIASADINLIGRPTPRGEGAEGLTIMLFYMVWIVALVAAIPAYVIGRKL